MMTKFLVILLVLAGICSCQERKQNVEGMLLINHIGYNLNGPKKVVLQTTSLNAPDYFEVTNSKDEVVYTGEFASGGPIDQWHTGNAFEGWFSDFRETGEFHIRTDLDGQILQSELFMIEDQLIREKSLPLLVKGFEGVRSEGVYEQKDSNMSFFGDRNDTVDVHGGWYDASGEKGKYLSHLAFTNYLNPQQTPAFIWTMLESAEQYRLKGGNSGQLVSDLQNEAAFGADFLVRMQDPEGYFYQTIFATWSWDPDEREICAYFGQHGERSDKYQSGFREGGGVAIAALARSYKDGVNGEYNVEEYLNAAKKGFAHLLEYNLEYADDGIENILDDYCALLAATELYAATDDGFYLDHARKRTEQLTARLAKDDNFEGWWRADDSGKRPYFHGSEAGFPILSLCKYLEVETDTTYRDQVIDAIQASVDFELSISNEVLNPFGYARQYIKAVDETEKRSAFFIPHKNESGYWWQGENARLASLSAAFYIAIPFLQESQITSAQQFASDQINWILGLNPYDACMLDGIGRNNPDYREGEESLNIPGGVCNGITAGFDNEQDIAFMPLPYNDDLSHRWRWSEQWTLHGAWLMLATAASQ